MPSQTADEVKKDMVEYFGSKVTESKFFEDYAQIGSYLSNPALYLPALRQLDGAMEMEFLGRAQKAHSKLDMATLNKHDKAYLQNAHKANALAQRKWDTELTEAAPALMQFKKLLTGCLESNELKHDFKVAENNVGTDIVVGLPERFNQLLRDRKPFKDIGAGREHGEYSHRIQWYLITQMTTLQNKPVEIYEKLPGWSTKATKYTSPRPFYMWEFLVDRDGVPSNAAVIPFKTKEQEDFRAPSNVNRWLVEQKQSETCFSWLNACLKRRWEKRERINVVLYVARKAFRLNVRSPSDIDDPTYEKIIALVKKGILERSTLM